MPPPRSSRCRTRSSTSTTPTRSRWRRRSSASAPSTGATASSGRTSASRSRPTPAPTSTRRTTTTRPSGGDPGRTIDEVPFRWLMGDGVVLDMRAIDRVAGIREAHVRAELDRIGYALKPYDIVLVRTDVSERYGEPGYELLHPGLRRDATAWLVGQGVKLIGIDAWGIDRPFDLMADEARAGDDVQLWESHKFGADEEYLQIEKLCNLAALPSPFGFQVLALPVRLEGASGAWARVVALVPR